jgi:hypothetical protein
MATLGSIEYSSQVLLGFADVLADQRAEIDAI